MNFEIALFLMVMVSPLWIMPFSTPVFSDVVVVMHHDNAVSTAVRTIVENVPDVQVVEYGSLGYALIIHRAVGKVVWVSHGSEKGILAGSQSISWKAFSGRIKMTPGRDIVLACNSEELDKYVSTNLAIGFKGIVDAILGGLVVSYLLEPQDITFEKFFERAFGMINGAVTAEALVLEGNEIKWAGIGILFLIVSILAGKWMANSLKAEMVSAIGKALAAGLSSLIISTVITLCGVITGEVSVVVFILSLVGVVIALVYYLIISIPLWKAWIAGMLTVSITNPYLSFISNISTLVSMLFLFLGLLSDVLDSGDGGQANTFWG